MSAPSSTAALAPAADARASATPVPQAARAERARTLFLRAACVVTGFWWMATGLVVALQRTGAEPVMGAACAAAALVGAWLVARTSMSATPRGVRLSFVGSALLWASLQGAFYAGWLVGPAPMDASGATARSLALALEALHATWHADAAALLLIGGVAVALRRAAQPTALHVLVAFWSVHQVARLCLFAGVANPATRFLPEELRYLAQYFGAPRNSPLLGLALLVVAAAAMRLMRAGARAGDPPRRERLALLAVLAALGAVELLFLAMPVTVPLWELFLRLRGQG